ncbi:glyoxylate/hydroxypyruvate reductase A [Inhella inkyongensis]|uniref:Glyoxylate/hydroxypyruvate reductase A n=1 Tax=Inhella inkyongensis TaxID=392593 RepID=A0A840S9C4_9BURK|nr:glyoxylate/hydroxypyruvate reductase A [Inhella inkyongensis]MBB5205596.1 glyoxylate/hydroxypyruvate reductase A [Inhella inkyongensis]
MIHLTVCKPGDAGVWAQALQAALGAGFAVSAWEDGAPPADYAVVWKPSAAFFAQQTQLKALFAAGAGVDGLLALKPPAHIPLIRLEDAGMGVQMAEYVLHALLRWFRRFDRYAEQAARAEWQPLAPERKADWPVGLLGYGALGQPVAQALRALGFPVQAWVRSARPADIPLFAGPDQLPAFLRRSRVLVAMVPLTPETARLLNAERLALLPQGAYLINVARGGLVDEAALLAALDSGHLAGAALDVCTPEPAPPEHPFWKHPKVALTPHISAATLREESIQQISAKLQALLRGEAVSGVVGAGGY